MNSDAKEWAFRFHVADSLRLAPQNKYITTPLKDIIFPRPADNRTCEEITAEVVKKTGITLI